MERACLGSAPRGGRSRARRWLAAGGAMVWILASQGRADGYRWEPFGQAFIPRLNHVVEVATDSTAAGTIYVLLDDQDPPSVARSADGGFTWSRVSVGYCLGSATLAAVPSGGQIAYVASRGGSGCSPLHTQRMVKTRDGGATWTPVESLPVVASAITSDPTDPLVLYVAALYPVGSAAHKTTDGGATWSPLGASPDGSALGPIAVDPLDTSQLYAPYAAGIAKSVDGGSSWQSTGAGLGSAHIRTIAIDPAASGRILAAAGTDGVFASTDGGASWTASSVGLAAQEVRKVVLAASGPPVAYSATRSAGIFVSSDGGATWVPQNSGLSIDESGDTPPALAVTGPSVISNASGVGLHASSDLAATWAALPLVGAPVAARALASSPSDSTILYAGTEKDGALRSHDSGVTWHQHANGLPSGRQVGALAVHPADPARALAGVADGGVYQTVDGGGAWAAMNAGLPATSTPISIAFDPGSPATIFAAVTSPPWVYRSTNGGSSWSPRGTGLPTDLGPPSAFAMDPVVPSTLYAIMGFRLFKSTDSGGAWGLVTAAPIGSGLLLDPTTPGVVYLGQAGGVARSADGGGTWSTIKLDVPSVAVTAIPLAIDPSGPRALLATAFSPGLSRAPMTGGIPRKLGYDGVPDATSVALPLGDAVLIGSSRGLLRRTASCSPAPQANCRRPIAPGRSTISLVDLPSDAGDKLTWKWAAGEATPSFDDGSDATYSVCVYDEVSGVPALVLEATMPAGGRCTPTKPCWSMSRTGSRKFASPSSPGGIQKATLKPGAVDGRSSFSVIGKGAGLGMPALPLSKDPKSTFQLVSSAGNCWEASFSLARKSDAKSFVAGSD